LYWRRLDFLVQVEQESLLRVVTGSEAGEEGAVMRLSKMKSLN
jgi:hypothetical protein